MEAVGITDHGVLYGAMQFYTACRDAGVKPILGMEGYMAPGDHRSKTASDRDPSHIVLLAKNEAGWRNLIKLSSKAQLDGFYYKPRMDREMLAQHSEGLIALSGCLNAEVAKNLLAGNQEEANNAARWYKDVFGDDYYFELQNHPIPELTPVNEGLVRMSKELGVPLAATNDSHYVLQSESYAHDVLLCIQTNANIYDEKRMKFTGDSFYLKSPQEMALLFPDHPEALENTMRIAEKCDVTLEFGKLYLPEYQTTNGQRPEEYLAELCWAGLRKRYGEVTEPLERRLQYELEVIEKTQFPNYFLVVWDIVRYAQEQGILYGVRGSAAASLVLYCLGITEIDPLGSRLVFERFLNLERKEMPDIDMDFQDDRRDEMITYVAQKYGYDHVAQIITFGTLGAKASIRDVTRALGLSYGDGDRVARLIPPALNMNLDRALEESSELAALYESDEPLKQLIDTAKQLEGTARHASTHAAGVVISKEPLMDLVPLQNPSRGTEHSLSMTQWPMEDVAHAGLLKMDFLGLINLSILGKARDLIAQTQNVQIDLQNLPLDDTKTFDLLSDAETTGVFQLESAGMRRYIKELRPQSIAELAAMVALYRPGPMQHIPTYIASKHGRMEVHFPHPALEEILEDTYGVIVYQDQVLLILQHFAGYTLGQADIVRKAMGKKITEMMQAEREHFVAGAVKKGFQESEAIEIFDLIEPFAGYAFNKAHATSYALIAYQTAYLKANYPAEYMCAFMTCFKELPEKLASAVSECTRLGVEVLPPDINRSGVDFTVEQLPGPDGSTRLAARFCLSAIKNVGEGALKGALDVRNESGPYTSLQDFLRRADLRGLNKRALECLIKAGALDAFGRRGALLLVLDQLMATAQRQQRLKETGQTTMFDLWGGSAETPLPEVELPEGDVPVKEKLAWERELMGVYVSEHPFTAVAPYAAKDTTALCGQIDEELVGQTVRLAGMVSAIRPLLTKDGRSFLAVNLEDLVGSVEVTVWPEVYQRTQELWSEGEVLLVRGKVTDRRGAIQLSCEQAERYAPAQGAPPYEEDGVEVAPALPVAAPISVPPPVAAAPEPPVEALTYAPLPEEDELALPAGVREERPIVQPLEPPQTPPATNAPSNDNGSTNGMRSPNGDGHAAPARSANGNGNGHNKGRTLNIHLYESQDNDRDLNKFQDILSVLERHPGKDVVKLTVFSNGTAVPLELPGFPIQLDQPLLAELGSLVGEGALQAEGV